MKRLFLLCIVAGCFTSFTAKSQIQEVTSVLPFKINLGIKVGLNFSKLNGQNWDNGYKSNLLGGAFLGVNRKSYGFQIEGLFTQSTYQTGANFFSDTILKNDLNNAKDSLKQGSFRVNYLSVPLLFQFRFIPRVWIQLGAQYSGMVSVTDINGLVKDAKGLFKTGDLSGVAGIWIRLPLHLNIGARYVFGITNINNISQLNESWKKSDVQVHIGLSF